MNVARLILDDPAPGPWNMAVDESLLHSAARSGTVTLRVYAWSTPTLSLGYFQNYAERDSHVSSRECQVVRRATGGGAIVHDHEITYSLTGPVQDRTDRHLAQWYDWVHNAWLIGLGELGIQTVRCPETDPQKERLFLCFQRRCAGDLICASAKIGGSAQRRHARAALQHGSLLLKRSAAAPELAGIAELCGRELTGRGWLGGWVNLLARALRVYWEPGTLTDEEKEGAAQLERDKFAHPDWTHRR